MVEKMEEYSEAMKRLSTKEAFCEQGVLIWEGGSECVRLLRLRCNSRLVITSP